jgi:peptidyl-prolyl cis-trans isomerase B (cyclophilin B)
MAQSQKSDLKSSRGVVLAVVAVALVVLAGLLLVQAFGGDDEPAGTTSSQPSTRDVEAPPAGECIEPPALPDSPPTFDEVPDASIAEDAVWEATLVTTCGEIVVELLGDKAPQTVSSFIHLAREGYWWDSPCHRLVTSGIFVLQCGDPTGSGSGGPGYGYGVENAPGDYRYPRGTLAMARTQDPNSNGGQFFIVYDDTELPDPVGYSIFGEVVEGMEIVDQVAEAGVGGSLGPEAPAQPISILDVRVEKQG